MDMIKNAPEHPSHLFRMKKSSLIQYSAAVVALIVLVPQFSVFTRSWRHLTNASLPWLLISLIALVGTIIFATLVYKVIVPAKLPFMRTALIQLATYFTNRLLPSGLGGIGFNALYLVKQAKLSRTDAAVYATANNIVGFFAFSLCIALSTIVSDSKIQTDVPIKLIGLIVVGLLVILGLLSLAFKKVQKKVIDFVAHLFGVALTLYRQPWRILLATMFSIGITASYAALLWATTKSVGLELSVVDIFIAFVVGNAALTISPTPGGIGAVEAAITGVLISANVSASLSLAAVLLFRVISYWLPVLPGYIAFRYALKKNLV